MVAWQVAIGDDVVLNQALLQVETEKAVVELPSPFAGTVVELLAGAGETVPVGAPLVAIDTGGGPRRARRTEDKVPMLVGYGPSRGASEPPEAQRPRALRACPGRRRPARSARPLAHPRCGSWPGRTGST